MSDWTMLTWAIAPVPIAVALFFVVFTVLRRADRRAATSESTGGCGR